MRPLTYWFRELYKLKAGETFVITADTESDRRVVAALFNALRYCHEGEQQAETHVPGWYEPGRHVNCDIGYADTPGSHMLCGQIGWFPKLESINGRIVFDSSVVPRVGLLQEPIHLTIRSGGVVEVEGGKEV